MRACTVRITKCDEPLAWYADSIGETFKVYARGRHSPFFLLKKDYDEGKGYPAWRFIRREDCVEVEEET